MGLIHEVVPRRPSSSTRAKAWIKETGGKAKSQPWDEKGFKASRRPGLFAGGHADLHRRQRHDRGKTNDIYPAPKAIMSCVYEGLQLPIDTALRVETRYFVKSLLRKDAAA